MPDFDRRTVALGLAALTGACAAEPGRAAQRTPVVALLGDSITAGYGLRPSESLPTVLERELVERGAPAKVLNFGVSGDTTGGGLARVERVVSAKPDVAVVALGANDFLQGVPPERVAANLDKIVRRLQDADIDVVLAGLQAPPLIALIAPEWAGGYERAYARVARERGAVFHPSFLGEVALNPNLNQPDRIHPNASGVRVIADGLARTLAQTLTRGRRV